MDISETLRAISLPYERPNWAIFPATNEPKLAELSLLHNDGTWIFELPNHVLSMDPHTYRDFYVVDTIFVSPWIAGKPCCQRMS